MIGVGTSLGEAHTLVEAGSPERLEGQILGADRRPHTPAAPRPRPVLPPIRGEHSLGTLKDAAHARATSSATADRASTLLRLRPPGTWALQATYCDRAFKLLAGLHPFFTGLTTFPLPSPHHHSPRALALPASFSSGSTLHPFLSLPFLCLPRSLPPSLILCFSNGWNDPLLSLSSTLRAFYSRVEA